MKTITIAALAALTVHAAVAAQSAPAGFIVREYWTGIGGKTVDALTGAPDYPANPSGSDERDVFEAPVNWGDNYGTRIHGFVHAPATGSYTFRISGDDNCELWLSTDDSPDNAVLIASAPGWTRSRQWDKYAEQQSDPIELVAGQRYYIMALHKERSGGDNLAVGWQLPDGTREEPIPGARLAPYAPVEDYSSWLYSEQIYLSTSIAGADVRETVSDFPVLVRLRGEEFTFDDWAYPDDGRDTRFSLPDGTELPFEIEQWSNEPGTADDRAAIWVRLPSLAGNTNDQYITMHWGRDGAEDRSNPARVFARTYGHAGIFHLDERPADSTGGHVDATGTGIKAKPHNFDSSGAMGVPGLIGRADRFDGVSEYLMATNRNEGDSLEPRDDISVSCWIKPAQIRGGDVLVMDRRDESDGASWASYWLYLDWGGGRPRFSWTNTDGVTSFIAATTPVTADSWWHVMGVREGSALRVYVNGRDMTDPPELISDASPSGRLIDAGWGVRMGAQGDNPNFRMEGLLDEVRIEGAARSAGWAKLCYENQKPGQTLVWFGAPPTAVLAPPSDVAAAATADGYLVSWTDNSPNEHGFDIYAGETADALALVGSVDADITTFALAVSQCDLTRVFGVRAVAGEFESSMATGASPAYTYPCVPSTPQAAPLGSTEIQVGWSGSSPEYALAVSVEGGAWTEIMRGTPTSFVHQGLLCAATHAYRVKGVNPSGESAWSGEAEASTPPCPVQTPTGLTADNATPGRIRLTWTDNADNEIAYHVYRKQGQGGFSDVSGALAANTVSHDDPAVECETAYTYYVKAVAQSAESGASNQVDVTTLYCGAGKATAEMVSVAGMIVEQGEPVNGVRTGIVVRLYDAKEGGALLYTETYKCVTVRNGYVALPVGLTGDVAEVVRGSDEVYYDIVADGESILPDGPQPLTAGAYALNNSYNLHGEGSPVGTVGAPMGAAYVDTDGQRLYMKVGAGDDDWVLVGP